MLHRANPIAEVNSLCSWRGYRPWRRGADGGEEATLCAGSNAKLNSFGKCASFMVYKLMCIWQRQRGSLSQAAGLWSCWGILSKIKRVALTSKAGQGRAGQRQSCSQGDATLGSLQASFFISLHSFLFFWAQSKTFCVFPSAKWEWWHV